jgi:class 3 adenylate cyclase
MEPQIQYARTSDGVSIAYSTIGEGAPLVHMSGGVSHCALEWDIPECRRWYEALARRRRLVRFDARGTGLSERDVSTFALENGQQDVVAVVDRLGLETFALFASMNSAPIAVAYAARYPERVSRLILWSAYASASEWTSRPVIQASRSLVDKDWVFFTETLSHLVYGWSEGEPARRYAALMRESITREFVQAFYGAMVSWDVAPLLPKVSAPTLVLQRRDALPGVEVAGSLAARIPDARLVILAGESTAPYLGDSESALAAIEEFLSEDDGPAPSAGLTLPSGTAIILFTDIADSTALTESMGDAAFRAAERALDERLRAAIREVGGTPVEGKVLGDGVMATFASAREAIDAALRCRALSAESELRLHVGVHAGDVIREQDNVYGGAVNIASRICTLSAPGEILVSDVVRGMARSSAGVAFEDRGEQEMKGVGEPVRVYAVRAGGA